MRHGCLCSQNPPKTWKRRLVYAAATLQVTEGKWLGGVVRGYGLISPSIVRHKREAVIGKSKVWVKKLLQYTSTGTG